MALECSGQFPIGRLFHHVRQRFENLLLGVVDVLQDVDEQLIHRLDVFREQSHG
jgi:hypothetical protein